MTKLRLSTLISLLAACLVILAGGDSAAADAGVNEPVDLQFQLPSGSGAPQPYPKLDSQLNWLIQELLERLPSDTRSKVADGLPAAVPAGIQRAVAQQAPIHDDTFIAVAIHVNGDPDDLVTFLNDQGSRVANIGDSYLEVYVQPSLLPTLDQHPAVSNATAMIPPRTAVTSEGAAVHGSPAWNSAGFTGAGIKVGVIDLGFVGYGGLIVTELPTPTAVRCYTGVGAFTSLLADCETGTEHGTAVAETVVDVAPDAILYLATPKSWSDLKSTVQWMTSQGVQIINHSVVWGWAGPGDGTSIFSTAPVHTVDDAVTAGAMWANAAGNAAHTTWTGGFIDPDLDGFNNFGPADETNAITLGPGETITAQLRWTDSWPGATSNMNLYLYDKNLNLVASSTDVQDGSSGSTPYELLSYTANSPGTYHLAVRY
ncbi:MAG: S8 family serine peptidase, partial [Chloroflexi bacterium]|nr:S8 family serine peptidase [Chloroflexota bacterium]